MKFLLFTSVFLVGLLGASAHAEANDIPTFEVRDLMQDCRTSANEARCLRQGLRGLIRIYAGGGGGNPTPQDRGLTCLGQDNVYGVYDNDRNRFVDRYYAKSLNQCETTIANVRNNMICVSSLGGRFAMKNIVTDSYVGSQDSQVDLNSCVRALNGQTNRLICSGGPNGLFARLDYIRNQFLDGSYSLNLNQCLNSI